MLGNGWADSGVCGVDWKLKHISRRRMNVEKKKS